MTNVVLPQVLLPVLTVANKGFLDLHLRTCPSHWPSCVKWVSSAWHAVKPQLQAAPIACVQLLSWWRFSCIPGAKKTTTTKSQNNKLRTTNSPCDWILLHHLVGLFLNLEISPRLMLKTFSRIFWAGVLSGPRHSFLNSLIYIAAPECPHFPDSHSSLASRP